MVRYKKAIKDSRLNKENKEIYKKCVIDRIMKEENKTDEYLNNLNSVSNFEFNTKAENSPSLTNFFNYNNIKFQGCFISLLFFFQIHPLVLPVKPQAKKKYKH